MNKLTTILLGSLALAVIIFLVIYEPLTRSTRENQAAVRSGLVLRLDPSKVRIIRITSGDNELEIRRKGNGWQLGSKSKDRADPAVVGQILQIAANLQFFDRMDVKGDDESIYGLRRPKRKIEFVGEGKITLFLGKDAANVDRIYVRSSESRDIFLVGDDLLRVAFRDAADLRDRRLTDLGPNSIDRFIIRQKGGEVEFLRDAIGWQITKPLNARADDAKIQEYLNRLLSLQIIDFVAEDTGDLSIYGLSEGQNEIAFFAEGSERRQLLRLGQGAKGELFGQFTARDSVYHLPPEAMDLLQVQPEGLRDRHLLSLNQDVIDLIRVRTPEREFTMRRNSAGWELKGDGAPRAVNEAVMAAFWKAMQAAEVSRYLPTGGVKLPEFGLDPPLFTLEFLSILSENTPEARAGEQLISQLSFGKSKDGQVFARLNASPEIATVPDSTLNAVPLDPEGWVAPK